MPREIADRTRVVEAVKHLSLTSELFEEQNGKQKYGSDLEVIVQGREYSNGKQVVFRVWGIDTAFFGH